MRAKTPKPKTQTPRRKPRLAGGVTIGAYRLARTLWPKGIWIMHKSGEAMMTGEDRLEQAIARYWKRNF